MFVRLIQIPVFLAAAGIAQAGNYLTENPNETFADLYARLGIVLTEKIVRDPQVWSLLEQLNREQCDQRSITDLGLLLDKRGYRREAAESLYNFVRTCGAPISALRRSINLFLVLRIIPKQSRLRTISFEEPPLITTLITFAG